MSTKNNEESNNKEENKMINSPDLENLVEILKKENSKQEIFESEENIGNLLYFLREENIGTFYKEIEKNFEISEENKYENIIVNLVQFFPLTEEIVKKIIYHMKNNENKYIDQGYDISGILINNLRFFLSNFDKIKDTQIKKIKTYNLQIEKYNKQKEELESRKKEIKEKGAENQVLYNEVENLKKEVEELKISFSEEGLENKKIELQQERENFRKKEKEFAVIQGEIEKIARDIANLEGFDDNEAFEEFKRFTKKIIKNND